MVVQTHITETRTYGLGCDLCKVYGGDYTWYEYSGSTPAVRRTNRGVVSTNWIEWLWTVDAVCAGYVDSGNRLALERRILIHNHRMKRIDAVKRIDTTLAHLRRDTKRMVTPIRKGGHRARPAS